MATHYLASTTRPEPERQLPVALHRPYVASLDVIRLVAILGVIAIHVASPLLATFSPEHPAKWWIANTVFALSRWTVPAFVMISGGLALTSRHQPVVEFYRRRVPRIVVPLLAWSVAYWIFRRTFWGEDLDLAWWIRSMLSGTTYGHLYFLVILLGLSLTTPVLLAFWKSASERDRAVVTVMAVVFGLAFRLLQEVGIVGSVSLIDWWLPYLGYYLAGALILEWRPAPTQRLAAAVLFALTAVGIALSAWIARTGSGPLSLGLTYSYLGPLTILNSLSAYAFAVGLVVAYAPDRLRAVASLVLGVYLFSPMVVAVVQRTLAMPSAAAMALGAVVVETVGVFIVAASVTAVASRIPIVRRAFV